MGKRTNAKAPPTNGVDPVGAGRSRQPKGGSRAKQIGQRCISIGFQGFRCIWKQLEEHPIVPGHLGVKHARLPSSRRSNRATGTPLLVASEEADTPFNCWWGTLGA